MSEHKFKVGERVVYTSALRNAAAGGSYEVVRLLPVDVVGEPHYRVKNGEETHERVVREAELSSA